MNYYRLRYILYLLPFYLISISVQGASCEKLIISANTNNPPISFEQNNILRGIGFDLLERLLSDNNTPTLRTTPLPWKRALLRSKNGSIDVLIGVRKTPEREQYLDFIEPAFTTTAHTAFFKKGESFVIKSREDLQAYEGGSTFGSVLDNDFAAAMSKEFKLQEVSSVEQNFLKLMAGRIDYFIAPLLPTIHIIQALHPQKIKQLTFLNEPVSITKEYIAISKNSECRFIKSELQTKLQEVKQNGTFDQWLGGSMAGWQSFDWYIENQE